MSLFGDDLNWAKVMFGENAIHVPITMTVQRMGSSVVLFVGASRGTIDPHPLMLGSTQPHVHILGDAVFRPHWAGEGDKTGTGASGLLTGSSFADADEWKTILGEAQRRT